MPARRLLVVHALVLSILHFGLDKAKTAPPFATLIENALNTEKCTFVFEFSVCGAGLVFAYIRMC